MDATPIVNTQNILGEGPVWHSTNRILYWVDIDGKVVHSFQPGTNVHGQWPVPKRVGTVALKADGNLLLGLQGEIAEFDPATGSTRMLAPIEQGLLMNRCNDGKCDPAGRFWVGTMHVDCKPKSGSLYCIDQDHKSHRVLKDLTISNGMGWSPDGAWMYFIDSMDHAVKRFKFDKTTTTLEEGESVIHFEDHSELPDGMCVDEEGMLWIAFWGGSRVGRYNPVNADHLADVRVPAPHVTSCCFGGEDLSTLFITTARAGLSAEQLEQYPLSGSLFSCPLPARGLRAYSFRSRQG